MAEIIGTLTPLLRGWGQYHRHGQNVGLFTKLDKWVRQRLRAYTEEAMATAGRVRTEDTA